MGDTGRSLFDWWRLIKGGPESTARNARKWSPNRKVSPIILDHPPSSSTILDLGLENLPFRAFRVSRNLSCHACLLVHMPFSALRRTMLDDAPNSQHAATRSRSFGGCKNVRFHPSPSFPASRVPLGSGEGLYQLIHVSVANVT